MKLENWWLKFGCFLTGYNYNIVSICSETASKNIKKYTSALLIVSILWAFIGYTFTERYLKAGLFGSVIGALIFVIIIVQVERQILLASKRSWLLYVFRTTIALLMAFIGSTIIDQIIFKDDIEQKKIVLMDKKVNEVYPSKSAELRSQIRDLDSTITSKEQERKSIQDDIVKNPTIKVVTQTSQQTPVTRQKTDSTGTTQRVDIINTKGISVNSIVNPKTNLLPILDEQIAAIRSQKAQKDNMMLDLRPQIEKEIKSKVGFLDELDVMMDIIKGSTPALLFWLFWLFFLVGLELFILVSKASGESSDYEVLVAHQMNIHNKKIELLGRRNDAFMQDNL